ncbi:hypothetical protein [Modestobacter sp. NPDC049651]|uniref:hypothetical protein n=1 Tax=unclassified Modestobacter TaxID=2643866 RepID=UPI003408A988
MRRRLRAATRRVPPRAARVGSATAGGLALLAAAGLVWHSAYAGFSDASAARNLPTVTTGTITLTDDDAGGSLFTVTGIKPGASGSRCIQVTATGSAPVDVRPYVSNVTTTNGLATYLSVTLTAGAGGSFKNCNGFTALPGDAGAVWTAPLSAAPRSWTAGKPGWTTSGAGAETRSYRVDWSLPASTPSTAQGGSAGVTLVWEARTR